MINFSESVTIQKPVAELYSYVSNQCNVPQWQKTVTNVEGPDGPLTKGARYINTRKFLGKEVKSTLEVEEVTPNRSFGLRSTDGPIKVHVHMTFEPIGSGTRMSTHMQAEVGGFFKLAESAVGKQMREEIAKTSLELKDMLEKKM